MSRYFAEISCIEGYRNDMIFHGEIWINIGPVIFRGKSREIVDFS